MPPKKKPAKNKKKSASAKELEATVVKLRARLERAETRAERWKQKARRLEASAAESEARLKMLAKRPAAPASTEVPRAATSIVPDGTWTVTMLRAEARARGLAGYSNKTKAQLLADLS